MGGGYHIILVCFIPFLVHVSFAELCKTNHDGKDYRGKINVTRGGLVCQEWSSKVPNRHRYSTKSHPDAALEGNYCRNPDGEPDGPWCYTTSKQKRWDYCYIPLCEPDKCKKTVEGKEYRGLVSQTKRGVVCQRWDLQEPHSHGITPDTHRDSGLNMNYCRNPDGEPEGPWCYTSSAAKRWDYCDIPLCDPCSDVTCGFNSRCVVSRDGDAKCECIAACPLIFKPVCGSDGKTYPNKCVLELHACRDETVIDVVKEGGCEKDPFGEIAKTTVIEGTIELNKEVSIDSKSCLLITLREAIYCTKLEDCPDKSIKTQVIRNVSVSPDNLIPYKLVVKSNLEPNRYLIEATLNRGWCHLDQKDDKKWIRDGDFFNIIEHSIEIDKAGNYDKDIAVSEYEEEEQKLDDGSKSKCEKHRQEVYDTFPVVNGEKLPMPGAYVPQCNKDGSYKEEQCHGSTGYCWCVDENGKKREETQVKFKKPNCKKDPCDGMVCKFYSHCKVSGNGTASCQCVSGCPMIYRPVCGSDGKSYANDCVMEFESCISKTEINVAKQGECSTNKTAVLGEFRKPTTIKGHVVLGLEGNTPMKPFKSLIPEVESKSCLVITVREAIYCTKFEDCPDTTIATQVIRNFTVSPDNWIPYKILIEEELEANRYLIEATLNRGWCYVDQEDDKKWIREGDFFNDIEHSVEIDKPGIYDKDIAVRDYKGKKPNLEKKRGKENKSECEKERQSVYDSFPVILGKKRPLVGAFIPQCNEDGTYKEVQCHGSTGYCWCVDESGKKREETQVRFKQPKCEEGKDSKSECEKERQSVYDSFPVIDGKKRPLLGAFIPQCHEDGAYREVQCHGSTGYCWCVDESGKKREETQVRFKQPKCGKESKSKCENERQMIFDSFPIIGGKRVPRLGAYIPQCNEDGSYNDVQCREMACWCVDKNGTKREGTEVRFKIPDCSNGSKSKCEKHRQEVYDTFPVVNGEKLPMPGAYVPQCNKDGSYKEEQCHGSTGFCWCVDENGKKREETQVRFKKPIC